jgi:hypothetical protein
MAGNVVRHTTQPFPAYEPPNNAGRYWLLIAAGLGLTAIAALSVRPVCHPDAAGANETGFGVRHEQRGRQWYHCEPWIRGVLRD